MWSMIIIALIQVLRLGMSIHYCLSGYSIVDRSFCLMTLSKGILLLLSSATMSIDKSGVFEPVSIGSSADLNHI